MCLINLKTTTQKWFLKTGQGLYFHYGIHRYLVGGPLYIWTNSICRKLITIVPHIVSAKTILFSMWKLEPIQIVAAIF